MENDSLYSRLVTAYTQENLNKITARLITAYRAKNRSILEGLAGSIHENVPIRESRINKLFSRLIMLYHPDRLEYYLNEIRKYDSGKEPEGLGRFTHILSALEFLDRTVLDSPTGSKNPDQGGSQTSRRDDSGGVSYGLRRHAGIGEAEVHDFMSALKQEEYGNLEVFYGIQDLMNMEGGLELSGYNINDLTGLEYCENLNALDLSHNNIRDISPVGGLRLLEELDLSFNRILRLDSLSALHYLVRADLSFNDIADIGPLSGLERLEYLNIVGNPVPKQQIRPFLEKGCLVIVQEGI